MISTYYISIGNSDDKLTQSEWSQFVEDIDNILIPDEVLIHGRWFSAPDASFQNACWCIAATDNWIKSWLKLNLRSLARRYRQDSIALATAETEFIKPFPVAEARDE